MTDEIPKGHWLVYGQTGAGKSSYLKYVVADKASLEKGKRILVYDPFHDDDWPEESEIFDEKGPFHVAVWKARNAVVIHDEAGDGNKRDQQLEKLAIQARHLGHTCYFAAQRPQMIATTIRGQASNLVVFHLVPRDSEFLAEEFGNDRILEAQILPPLEYMFIDRWGKVRKGKVVFPEEENSDSQ